MLDTSLADADKYPLKLSDLMFMVLNPTIAPAELACGNDSSLVLNDAITVGFDGDRAYKPFMISQKEWRPYTGTVIAIDPSGRGGDETAYAVVSTLNGRLFLLDAGGYKGGYDDDTLEALANKAKEYNVKEVIVEPNFGDGMFNKILSPVMQRVYPCKISETERSNAQKEKRIVDCLEPVINGHRLVVDRKLLEKDFKSTEALPPEQQNRYRLFYQMTRLTQDRGSLIKDDRIDAVALAMHYWTAAMTRDMAKVVQQKREEEFDRELAKYLEQMIGQPPARNSLIDRLI